MRAAVVALALSAMLAAGCASNAPATEGEEQNALIAGNFAAADRLLSDSVRRELLVSGKRVLVASWVDVNQLNRSSVFGKMMAEQLASRLVQQGVPVVEVKLRSSLFMSERGGEMLLSREVKEVTQSHNADAVVVGTYADTGPTGIYVTLKMVRASDAMVMSASNFVIPRKLVSNVISR